MRDDLRRLLGGIERIIRPCAVVIAASSAWMSFLGYREFLAGLGPALGEFTAGIMGVACAVLLYLMFSLMQLGLPAVRRTSRAALLPFVVIAAVIAASFSTYTNVIVSAGGDALEAHANAQRRALEAANTRIQGVAQSIAQVGPALKGHAARLGADLDCELARGCKTGAGGRGDLTDALGSAAGMVRTAADTVETAEARIAALIPRIREGLGGNDEQIVRDLLTELNATLPLDSLRQTAAALRRDLGIEGTSANPDVRRRQDEAIAQLQRDLIAIADGIDASVERIEAAAEGLDIPIGGAITKAGAILLYWDQLVPQIALGLALDWALIFAALFHAKLRDALADDEDEVPPALTVTQLREAVGEWQQLSQDMGRKRRPAKPAASVEKAPDDRRPEKDPGKDHGKARKVVLEAVE